MATRGRHAGSLCLNMAFFILDSVKLALVFIPYYINMFFVK